MNTTNKGIGAHAAAAPMRMTGAHLPNEGFIDEDDFLALLPVGRSTFWEGIKTGRYPKPVKVSNRKNGWDVDAVRALFESINAQTSGKQNG
jgi:prophage regulatory protein